MTARARTESTPPPGMTAIIVGRSTAGGPVRTLIDRLASAGVATSIVDRVDDAGVIVRRLGPDHLPCVVLDTLALGLGDTDDDGETLAALVAATAGLAPGLLPIVVTQNVRADVAITCFRAGAGDVVDIAVEGIAAGKPALARVARRQATERARATLETDLRAMVEDFLRDLIRTERRSLDLEEQLTRRGRMPTGQFVAAVDGEGSRAPTVLLVEDDLALADDLTAELQRGGVTVFAYEDGEEAVAGATTLGRDGHVVDLALVTVRLPGIDGLETVRQLRRALPGLPAFLMTSEHDPDDAAHAADLGVVGYVYKPFADPKNIYGHIRSLAVEAMERGRERRYLRQIKERHEHVLGRYRAVTGSTLG